MADDGARAGTAAHDREVARDKRLEHVRQLTGFRRAHVPLMLLLPPLTWLLLHREWRDDKMCEAKYGEDWDEYRRRVPWRIIPYAY